VENANNQLMEIIMSLIMHGGDAKSNAMEAIHAAKTGNFTISENKLKDANNALIKAHKSQTSLLTQEASGDSVELSLLMIHGQDHLMNAITFKDIAEEIVDLYKFTSHN
jgi:PTS system cellobiose-specific IIA component